MKLTKTSTYQVSLLDEKNKTLLQEEYYNDEGLIILVNSFSPKEKLIEKHSFLFDEQNKIILEKIEVAEHGTTMIDYKYDEHGEILSKTITLNGELIQEEVVESREDYHQITTTNADNEEINKDIEYYKNGNMVESEHYRWGEFIEKQTITYDHKNTIIAKTCWLPEDNRTVEIKYENNKKNELIKEMWFEDEQMIFCCTINLDDPNNIIEEMDNEGLKTVKQIITGNNQTLEEILLDDKNSMLTRLIRIFDKQDNLVEERYFNTSGDYQYGQSYCNQYINEYK